MRRLENLLIDAAAAAPDAVAITELGAPATSYGALAAMAARVADALRQAGVGPGDRVGVAVPKSAASVAVLYGIMQAGAAYVPVDPSAPLARSSLIFSDCGVRAVFARPEGAGALSAALAEAGHPVADQTDIEGFTLLRAARPGAAADPALAYILYTSGSTGRPKGVQHSHASALAFVDWCTAEFSPEAGDRFSSHAPFHFDLSILDLYVPAQNGASVRLIGTEEGKQPGALAALIEEERITNWYSTPTILRLMAEMGDLPARDHSSLKRVCFAGEVFPTIHLKRLAGLWPHPVFHNLYGPTETNVCTAHRVDNPAGLADDAPIPIGCAVSEDVGRVVSPRGDVVPAGDEGELLIAGGSVMLGYWNAPERDAEVFVQADGRRWYRTGDVVTEPEPGVYLYRGRRDRMVKRRGYRVELGEIEAGMVRAEGISEAAAVAVEPEPGAVTIVLFHDWQGDGAPSLIALKRYANSVLPVYMIPDRFHRLEHLPLTSTDKTDYQKLKEIAHGLLAER